MEENKTPKKIKGLRKKKREIKQLKEEILKEILLKNSENHISIPEGTKVRINKKIMSETTWEQRNPAFKEFVFKSFDFCFTVEYDKDKKDNPKLVCLKEDPNTPKWLFYIGDLIILENEKEEKNEE